MSKSRHSSHPHKLAKEVSRFRECVAMDFLEFTIGDKKFHAHAFVDYHTTVAYVTVTPSRSSKDAASNLLWFLNKTEEYVTGPTLVRLVHDRAKEYMSQYLSNCSVYLAFRCVSVRVREVVFVRSLAHLAATTRTLSFALSIYCRIV